MDARTFSLTLPSDARMLSAARGFIEAVCEACRLDRATTHALVIITGEAVTNIVRHAHRDRTAAQMEIECQLLPNSVVMTFKDQGEPFDLASVPELPPGELRIGGRGLFLMRALSDELTCSPRAPGEPGNVLRLVKRCPIEALWRACG